MTAVTFFPGDLISFVLQKKNIEQLTVDYWVLYSQLLNFMEQSQYETDLCPSHEKITSCFTGIIDQNTFSPKFGRWFCQQVQQKSKHLTIQGKIRLKVPQSLISFRSNSFVYWKGLFSGPPVHRLILVYKWIFLCQ